MKNILVTGGAGFIGSHTCLLLLEKGYRVFIIDSFENSSIGVIKRISEIYKLSNKNSKVNLKIFQGSLCDKDFIEDIFSNIYNSNEEIDGVIHFAGFKAVEESIIKPLIYWRNNVLGTLNLLEVMSKFRCRNLVFSSSATIYKEINNIRLQESAELEPNNPYGSTKLTVEKLLKDLFESARKEWKFVSLRYFNPIGAHPSGLLGEYPKGLPRNIFPLITNTAIGIQKEFKIYGSDWPTKDGTTIRDYIHIMDLAECHIKILEDLIHSKAVYLSVNVGTGKGTSVLELIRTFELVNNRKIKFVFSERRPGDMPFVVADNSLLRSKFNIVPKRTIEDMCRDGWKWIKQNPNGI